MTTNIKKALAPLVNLDGVYGVRLLVPLGEKRPVIRVDAQPETRWHAQQGSFSDIAEHVDRIAVHLERSPAMPEAALVDVYLSPLGVRVTAYRIDDERTLVVFTKTPHQVTKSLTRSVRRVIPKLLHALDQPLLEPSGG